MKNSFKISKSDVQKMERAARRNAEIELQLPRVRHVVHTSIKQYNRQENKKFSKMMY